MKMFMKLTETDNIDYNEMKVKDNYKVIDFNADWEEEVEVFDINIGEKMPIQIKNISLFDHRLLMFGRQYHILNALSK